MTANKRTNGIANTTTTLHNGPFKYYVIHFLAILTPYPPPNNQISEFANPSLPRLRNHYNIFFPYKQMKSRNFVLRHLRATPTLPLIIKCHYWRTPPPPKLDNVILEWSLGTIQVLRYPFFVSSGPLDQSTGKLFHFQRKWITPIKLHIYSRNGKI